MTPTATLSDELLDLLKVTNRASVREATAIPGSNATSLSVNRTRPAGPAGEAYPKNRVTVTVADRETGTRQTAYLTPDAARAAAQALITYATMTEAHDLGEMPICPYCDTIDTEDGPEHEDGCPTLGTCAQCAPHLGGPWHDLDAIPKGAGWLQAHLDTHHRSAR